jgi:hypothetical protein
VAEVEEAGVGRDSVQDQAAPEVAAAAREAERERVGAAGQIAKGICGKQGKLRAVVEALVVEVASEAADLARAAVELGRVRAVEVAERAEARG